LSKTKLHFEQNQASFLLERSFVSDSPIFDETIKEESWQKKNGHTKKHVR